MEYDGDVADHGGVAGVAAATAWGSAGLERQAVALSGAPDHCGSHTALDDPQDAEAPMTNLNRRAFARGVDDALTLRQLREAIRAVWRKLLAVVATRNGR